MNIRNIWPPFAVLATALAFLSACGSSSPVKGCGPPPVQPAAPPVFLAYPVPNATDVPVSIGLVILGNVYSGDAVSLGSTGATIPAGALTPEPSPLPTPYATAPPSSFTSTAYFAAPIPTLSPSTAYTVKLSYQTWADNPPSCTTTETQQLGTFSTQ